jgi:hypothetical protein
MSTVIVSGALANRVGNGGGAWVRLSWIRGLKRLGFDVVFVEQIAPRACVDAAGRVTSFARSRNRDYFREVMTAFELDGRSALICGAGEATEGLALGELLGIAGQADLLINISGHLTFGPILERVGRTAFVDLDPGFTQFWHQQGVHPIGAHDLYFTVGENIGRQGCTIPTVGVRWRPVRQPVVLDDWPVAHGDGRDRFTTVASWRGPYGPVIDGGRTLGVKVHEFRKVIDLPRRVSRRLELALDISPGDGADRERLVRHGWLLADPLQVAGDPARFRSYVAGSAAEFSVAQGMYVETRSGWFSDRTVRYLAAGLPALVQDTGFAGALPVGDGLLQFATLREAIDGIRMIDRDYAGHRRAARAIAEASFDSDRVLPRFLDETGIGG